MITPPTSFSPLAFYSQTPTLNRWICVFVVLSCSLGVNPLVAADYKWSGQVNGHGNTGVSIGSNDTFSNFTVIVGGTPPSLWSQTTEGIILKNQSLTVTENVRIENTTSHNNLSNNGGIRLDGGATVDFTGLDSVRLVSIGGNHNTNESVVITLRSVLSSNRIDISANKVQIIGDIENTALFGSSIINIALDGTDSYWYGSLVGGKANISLSNGATWIYDADNESNLGLEGNISDLELNGGIVVLDDAIVDDTYRKTTIDNEFDHCTLRDVTSTDAKHTAVKITNLTGKGGTFYVDLDWRTNQGAKAAATDGSSDFITIKTAEDGSVQHVIVSDPSAVHLEDMKAGDKLYFASVGTGDTTFTTNLDGTQNSASELYSFDITTQKEIDDNQTYWFVTKSLGDENENTIFLRNVSRASYALAADLDRFHDRRAQSQYTAPSKTGFWVRYRNAKVEFDGAFDTNGDMIQIGFDHDVSTAGSRKFVGLSFDYTDSSTDIEGISGSGDNSRYTLNAYYSVLADCGGYADFVAKVGRISSDYNLRNNNGDDIGSELWQTYYGMSAEFGWKYDFAKSFFIEPQAQLQVIRIEGDTFSTNGGVRAKIDDADSLIGRLGIRSGVVFSLNKDLPMSSIYGLADVIHEFNADTGFRACGLTTSLTETESGKQTWYDVGFGTALNITKRSALHLDTKYIFGGDYDNNWTINAAVRYSF